MLINLDILIKTSMDPFEDTEHKRFDYHLLQFHKHYKEQSLANELEKRKFIEKELVLT